MKRIIIYGIGDFADIVYYYIKRYLPYEVVGFTLDRKYKISEEHQGLKVVPFDEIETVFKSDTHEIVIGVIGEHMFDERATLIEKCREKQYRLPNIICQKELIEAEALGEGNIFLPNVVVGPFSKIGDANIFWPGCVIPHHNLIGNFNHLAPSVTLSGNTKITNHCFIGNNVTLNNKVEVKEYTFVGAGSYVYQDTEPYSVIVPERSKVLPSRSSMEFM